VSGGRRQSPHGTAWRRHGKRRKPPETAARHHGNGGNHSNGRTDAGLIENGPVSAARCARRSNAALRSSFVMNNTDAGAVDTFFKLPCATATLFHAFVSHECGCRSAISCRTCGVTHGEAPCEYDLGTCYARQDSRMDCAKRCAWWHGVTAWFEDSSRQPSAQPRSSRASFAFLVKAIGVGSNICPRRW